MSEGLHGKRLYAYHAQCGKKEICLLCKKNISGPVCSVKKNLTIKSSKAVVRQWLNWIPGARTANSVHVVNKSVAAVEDHQKKRQRVFPSAPLDL